MHRGLPAGGHVNPALAGLTHTYSIGASPRCTGVTLSQSFHRWPPGVPPSRPTLPLARCAGAIFLINQRVIGGTRTRNPRDHNPVL